LPSRLLWKQSLGIKWDLYTLVHYQGWVWEKAQAGKEREP